MEKRIVDLFNDHENYNIKLITYYPYPSCITFNTILLSQNHNYKTEEHDILNNFGERIKKELHNKFPNLWGNKIVIEFKLTHKKRKKIIYSNLFLSYKDDIYSIGLGCEQKDGQKGIKLSKYVGW